MFKTRSLIDSLGVGEDGISPLYPETFSTDIGAAFDEDMGIVDGKIAGLEADIVALRAENAALKGHNYDLMMSAGAAPATDAGDGNVSDEDDDTDSDDSDEPRGMDRIFAKKEDD